MFICIISSKNILSTGGIKYMNILICDDEEFYLNYLNTNVEEYYKSRNISRTIKLYSNAIEMLEKGEEEFKDDTLILLDVSMPDISGYDAAKRIREINNKLCIIFVSNMDQAVYECMKYRIFRFIRKSHMEELEEALDAYENMKAQDYFVTFETKNGSTIIDIRQVVLLEVQAHDLTVHLKNEKIIISGTLNKYEEMLSKYGFIKTYKCYLVNYRYIKFVNKKDLMLDDGRVLAISRNSAHEIKEKMFYFIRSFEIGYY